MKKGYLSVPSYSTEKVSEEFDEKKSQYYFYSDTSPILEQEKSWLRQMLFQMNLLFLSSKQKEKMTRKSWMKKTRGIRLLFTLIFCTLSMYFIHRFIHNYAQLAIPYETAFDLIRNVPSSDHLRSHFIEYASYSHLAGSEQDETLATWTRNQWIEYGITDTEIETYYPLMNYPKTRRLAIVEGRSDLLFEASLEEQKSLNQTDKVPTFHAYSGSGNVTGPIVFANYGQISDFVYLKNHGVNFKGTIAMIRNGVIPRGLKIKMAEDFGCIGVVLFSDPEESSSCNATLTGSWRTSVERGSVQYLSLGVGDPSTPGYSAKAANETRVPLDESDFIPKIPSLPISWQDALPILKATEGLGIQSDPICSVGYFSGPSEALVNLVNINEYKVKPIWNVIGTIKGSEEPNRTIIIGNHRDAWGYGAVDPSSGSAVMMELVRALGVLLEKGWRPKRTIMIASWDAEEYGTVGSVEWIEEHAAWIKEQAVAYINVDYAVSGKHFSAQASPLLRRLLYEVTDQVIDPESSISVFARWNVEKGQGTDLPLTEPLSVDSDHVGFFHHLGISSISMGFRGPYSVHHSEFDSIQWMEQFGDPLFEYHQALTKIWGMLVLRLASDPILPLHAQDYTNEIVKHINRVGSQQGCLTFPYISSALHSLAATSIHFERTMKQRQRQLRVKKHISSKLIKQVAQINERLARFEPSFLDEQGLDRMRPWFKHVVYGPQLETGLTIPFPSLLEAVEKDDIVHIQWVEERIGNVLIQADRTLRGHFGKSYSDIEEDDDEFDDYDD